MKDRLYLTLLQANQAPGLLAALRGWGWRVREVSLAHIDDGVDSWRQGVLLTDDASVLLSYQQYYHYSHLLSGKIERYQALDLLLRQQVFGEDEGLHFRLIEKPDEAVIFQWQHEPGMRRYFHNPEPPTVEEHHQWVKQQLQQAQDFVFIIEESACAVGLLRAQKNDAQDYEVSILVTNRVRQRGIAKRALACLVRLYASLPLVATVKPDNIASVKLFTGAGFVNQGADKYRFKEEEVLVG